jgi:Gas vesicle protein
VSGTFSKRNVALVDLLDRVLDVGAVVTGDVTISLADIDLVRLDLRLLLASVASIDASRRSALALDPGTEAPQRALTAPTSAEQEPHTRPARSAAR